ncbi:hypothetical protein Mal35_08540 [Gimesia maris]|nr:hypothetical protein Mal35_08540 [Gimesia maris]
MFFILTVFFVMTVWGINYARSVTQGHDVEIAFPAIDNFSPSNSNFPKWKSVSFLIVTCLVISFAGVICLWVIRCMLPKKFKPYITWRKLKG